MSRLKYFYDKVKKKNGDSKFLIGKYGKKQKKTCLDQAGRFKVFCLVTLAK
jgi:hypothetical protein